MAMRFTNDPSEANAVTHGGNFHADDVFGLAFLSLSQPKDLIVYRSLNTIDFTQFVQNVIIFDIGHGKYDHHQKGGNGYHPLESSDTRKPIPYASFGLLWRDFGLKFCLKKVKNIALASKLWQYMEDNLIKGIDAFDNGLYPRCDPEYSYKILTISNLIALLNPTTVEGDDFNSYMDIAVSVAKIIFDTILETGIKKVTKTNIDISQNFTAEEIFIETLEKRLFGEHSQYEDFGFSSDRYHVVSKNKPVPMTKFGALWTTYGKNYCKSICSSSENANFIWEYINTKLVVGIDASISGIKDITDPEYVCYAINNIHDFIESLNIHDDKEYAHKVALNIATLILDRALQKAFEQIDSKEYIEKKVKESLNVPLNFTTSSRHILVLEKHVHWQNWIANDINAKDIWFVVSPSSQGGYIVRPVPCKYNENGFRKGFPKKWHGLSGYALQEIAKVHDATFVHNSNGFIAGANSLRGAILLAKRAFYHEENQKRHPSK